MSTRAMFLIRESLEGAVVDSFHVLGDAKKDAQVYSQLQLRARFNACGEPVIKEFTGPPTREDAQAWLSTLEIDELREFMREETVDRVLRRFQKVLKMETQAAVLRKDRLYAEEALF